ncbi:MAG: hypothetical protein H6751_15005 [Candidatus Omnitrophica bacterium]|nr:hypothetical protein [Candidatus Omnitrophota bacterium]
MTVAPKIGLLPLYLELYDKTLPEMRKVLDPFLCEVSEKIAGAGIHVFPAPVCRLRQEVEAAIHTFHEEDVDLIVTLHLAYSPSLEAVSPLTRTHLPILMLDTTLDESFGLDVDPIRLLYNHGIHGLQDLASVLRRYEIFPFVVAGHLSDPKVLERVSGIARAASAAKRLKSTRALRIGPVFSGMGDFQVEEKTLESELGIQVEEILPEDLLEDVKSVSEEEIEDEIARDVEVFRVEAPEEVHQRSNRLGLGLRKYLERNKFDAFSLNFLSFDYQDGPLGTVPFLECSKAMARGIGYAGEGDVLTASLVGALQSAFGQTTFTEIFCPDWKGDSIFLSHMGEVNPEVAAAEPRLYEKDFSFTPTQNPAVLTCAIRPGTATLVNLAPAAHKKFNLIAARVEVLEDGTHPDIDDWIRAWIRPEVPIAQLLEIYSEEFGGTHHSALMLGDRMKALEAFARIAGFRFCPIEPGGTRA